MTKEVSTSQSKPLNFPSIPVLLGVVCALILVIVLTYLVGPKVSQIPLLPQISPPPPPSLEGVQSSPMLPSPPALSPVQPPPPPALPGQ
ncbi:hypothetical protein A2Z23_00025 [Candidatus Curtissbacteria bacterium RBG_16_39_7]|uniref:Uncharacterized protein n=1 Tax=Candidatus Curtissbacteria bacterium RBG_16_39_7 TaxID=1797707 RepID=A0A1F5G3R9_9BACT|nr:MAG: hypothetical protein A2Z23_00025 [Candidatus Curtissbacteria bacterium RBG_16_39_7]